MDVSACLSGGLTITPTQSGSAGFQATIQHQMQQFRKCKLQEFMNAAILIKEACTQLSNRLSCADLAVEIFSVWCHQEHHKHCTARSQELWNSKRQLTKTVKLSFTCKQWNAQGNKYQLQFSVDYSNSPISFWINPFSDCGLLNWSVLYVTCLYIYFKKSAGLNLQPKFHHAHYPVSYIL